jgi:DNA polymerase III epsilon subunit-like protein
MPTILVIDTETSGLPNSQHATPIQVGVVILSGDEVFTDTWYVLPRIIDTQVFAQASRVNGITLAKLEKEGISQADSVDRLRALWVKHGKPKVYSYNASFDELMLSRMGWSEKDTWGPCLMQGVRAHLGLPRNLNLTRACEALGLPGPGASAHDAMADAMAAARIAVTIGAGGYTS